MCRGASGPLGGRPRGLRALGPAGRRHRPSHGRRRHRHHQRRGGDRAGARGGPHQRRDRPCSPGDPTGPPACGAGAGAGHPCGPRRPAIGTGHGSGSSPARTAGFGEPGVAARRLRAVRLDRGGGHDRRAGPRRRGPAGQGHDQGPGRLHGRQPGGRGAGSVSRGGVECRGGHPECVHHGGPPAGRHQLPQLRRPDAAGGLLAASGGCPRPGRRVSGARAPGDRRQCLAVQRSAIGGHRPDRGDRRRRTAG